MCINKKASNLSKALTKKFKDFFFQNENFGCLRCYLSCARCQFSCNLSSKFLVFRGNFHNNLQFSFYLNAKALHKNEHDQWTTFDLQKSKFCLQKQLQQCKNEQVRLERLQIFLLNILKLLTFHKISSRMIIHGYGQRGKSTFNRDLKNAFLNHDDYNVIVGELSTLELNEST